MGALGVSGMGLTRAVNRSQSSVARYYSDREPDYLMTAELEKALGLPPGVLIELAGYTSSLSDIDVLSALARDKSLTVAQKEMVLGIILPALIERGRGGGRDDVVVAAQADPRLSPTARRMLVSLVEGYRQMNRAKHSLEVAAPNADNGSFS
jgi:hypothetical protein